MPVAETRFVSLADALRQSCPPSFDAGSPVATPPASPPPAERGPDVAEAVSPPDVSELGSESAQSALIAIRSARLFRAAIGDAFDALLADLVRDLAAEVLARELRLGPADIAHLAQQLIADRFAEEPLRLRVAPLEVATVCDLPVVADPSLAPGDAVLECRSGDINARLGVRLTAVCVRVLG